MNVKKYLQQQSEKDRQAILSESDNQFLQDLKAKIDKQPSPAPRRSSRLRYWVIGAAGTLASIIAIVCVLVFYPFAQTDFTYYENNFVQSDSTLSAMDEDMREFIFNIDDSLYSVTIFKITDSVSGDTIMYRANITSLDTLINITFVAVCNKNYHYKGLQITNQYDIEELPRYDIHYDAKSTPDPDFGMDKFSAQAQIQKGAEYIYITDYYETMLDEQPRFFDIIQSIIQ